MRWALLLALAACGRADAPRRAEVPRAALTGATVAGSAESVRVVTRVSVGNRVDSTILTLPLAAPVVVVPPVDTTPAPPTPTATHEPAGMTLITHRPFDRMARSTSEPRCAAAPTTCASEGWDPIEARDTARVSIVADPVRGNVVRFAYDSGVVKMGTAAGTMITLAWPTQPRELYDRTEFYLSPNWYGAGTNKCLGFWGIAGSTNELFVSCEGYRDEALQYQLRLQGVPDPRARLLPNTGAPAAIARGVWHVAEQRIKLNTCPTPPTCAADGEWDSWLDGVQTHRYRDVRFLPRLNGAVGGFAYRNLNPTWGGGLSGVPVTPRSMFLLFGDVRVSGR